MDSADFPPESFTAGTIFFILSIRLRNHGKIAPFSRVYFGAKGKIKKIADFLLQLGKKRVTMKKRADTEE